MICRIPVRPFDFRVKAKKPGREDHNRRMKNSFHSIWFVITCPTTLTVRCGGREGWGVLHVGCGAIWVAPAVGLVEAVLAAPLAARALFRKDERARRWAEALRRSQDDSEVRRAERQGG